MIKRRLKHIFWAIALTIPCTVSGQDIHFSQFYETSILRNPALTGVISSDYKIEAIYRSQWSSISKPFQTGLIDAETRIAINEVNDFVSFGVLGYYDRAGSTSLQTTAFYPAVNYNKSLEDGHQSYLSVGFTGGYIQRSFDPTKMTTDNQFQGGRFVAEAGSGETGLNSKFNYFDIGAGISFSSTTGGGEDDKRLNYIIGISGYHFTKPRNTFYDEKSSVLAMKFNVSASVSKQVNDIYSYQLHVNYARQGSYNETIFGGLLGWNKKGPNGELQMVLSGGLFYRLSDALIPTVRLRFKDLAVTVNYDCNVSRLKAATNLRGGFEISLIKTGIFNDPEQHKSRTICPEFY